LADEPQAKTRSSRNAQAQEPSPVPTATTTPLVEAQKTNEVVSVLKNAALTDKDQAVREEAARSLTSLTEPGALGAIAEVLRQNDDPVIKGAVLRRLAANR
jgi:HEAT repeats